MAAKSPGHPDDAPTGTMLGSGTRRGKSRGVRVEG
jgi:hypothetical protein